MREVYKYALYVFVFFAFGDVVCEDLHSHEFDTFKEILKRFHTQDTVISFNNTNKLTGRVFQSLHCKGNAGENECNASLCLNVSGLFQTVGASKTTGLTELQFHQASLVIVYYMINVTQYCGQTIDPSSKSLSFYQEQTRALFGHGGSTTIQEADIGHALGMLNASYTQHADPHAGHQHSNHADEVKVVEDSCLSADSVVYRFGDGKSHVTESDLTDIAMYIILHVMKGSPIKQKCRLLPTPEDFLRGIAKIVNSKNNTITLEQFELLMAKLNLVSHHDHDHDHDHGTEVARKRRNALTAREVTRSAEVTLRRSRRSAPISAYAKECYSAEELLALHRIDHAHPLSHTQLTQLSPSLLYMQVSNSCVAVDTDSATPDTTPTDLERYGYSSLANVLVCMCAAAGALLYPCFQSYHASFDIFMATFLGLAVGTLSSDALLHLLPQAFGLHKHDGHGHDHGGSGIVVEEFVWFGLVTLAGLYFFYLIESIMTMAGGGHSHDDLEMVVNVNPPQENGKASNGELYKVDPHHCHELEKPKHRTCTAVSLMIILGDAIHNFADGLAMGAAFTQGITQGVATTIAIFCHELPHELGDFAVLIKTGMSFKRALAWNLMSSVTSFIGLYIGLSISTEIQTRQWIFSVTAGMFLYLALVDILPVLLQSKVKRVFLMFVMHNVGILLGFLAMILMAIFEDHIKL